MADINIPALATAVPAGAITGTDILVLSQGGVTKAGPLTLLRTWLQTAFAGLVISAIGIKFPAAQSASADANTLDDYEEGTFTPGIAFGGAAVGVTYSAAAGRYTKIGNAVACTVFITLSAKGSSTGNATITGLPFTSASSSYVSASTFYSVVSYTGCVETYISPSATAATLFQLAEAGTRSNLTDANFANTSLIVLSCTYFV